MPCVPSGGGPQTAPPTRMVTRVEHERRAGRVGMRPSLAVALAIAVATFLQAPGRIAPDTKIDLAIAPGRFLSRTLRLWQPDAALGYLQNQAAGYLFPMGPFFLAGSAARIPMWLVQRAWIAALLVVALWGAVRMAERLEIGSPVTRVVGGAAYALSPAMTALVGSTSGGQLPAALLPWVLVPLIDGATEGSPRRAAARSALAVVAMGAVNAASTLAVLPLAGLWLVTRRPGPRRRRLTAWWLGLLALGTSWWTIALVVQARYGLHFVPFTEQADVTTATTAAVEVMRGAGYWLSSVVTLGPWLPAGWTLQASAVAIAGTVALTAAGIVGLARRDMPERVFSVTAVGLGVAVIGAGYAGSAGGPLADAVRSLLDGPLSAFRNVHKFEPVVQLPLAMGVAHTAASVRFDHRVTAGIAAIAVALAAMPLLRGELLVNGSFERLPRHWRQAAAWLEAREGRSLVVPASEFGEYEWGRPLDEPLQPLAAGSWAVRNLIPLGSDGATRVLDALGRRVESGDVTGLAETLDRTGLRYLVVRNDLDPLRTTGPRAPLLRARLVDVPGLVRVAAFGPPSRVRPTSDRLHPDVMPATRPRAVEIYEVRRGRAPVRALPVADTLVVSGGPESMVELTGLGDRPVVLAGDGPTPPRAPALLTDGLRLRDVDFGRVRGNTSYVLTEREPAPDSSDRPADRVPVDGRVHRTTAAMTGAVALTASSYGPATVRTPEAQPYAAFDGDPVSGWVPSAIRDGVGQWLQLTLDRPMELPHVDIRQLRSPGWRTRITEVAVSTDHGVRRRRLASWAQLQRVRLPPGPTRRVRITITDVTGRRGAAPGLAEVALPGVDVQRPLRVPDDQAARLRAGAPLGAARFQRSAADPFDATRSDEERRLQRELQLTRPATFALTGTARGRPGAALGALVASLAPTELRVTTSSVWGDQPVYRGEGAVDGDSTTAWVAAPDDPAPALDLSWPGARTIDAITIRPAVGPTAVPRRLRLSTGTEQREVDVDRNRASSFAPLTTDRLTVTVVDTAPTPNSIQGLAVPVATGIGELDFEGLDGLRSGVPDLAAPVTLPCGAGPEVIVDGTRRRTAVDGRLGELLRGRPLAVTGCDGTVELAAGRHRIDTTLEGPLAVDSVDLTAPRPTPATPPRATSVTRWSAEDRTVRVGPGAAAYLMTGENANDGWRATLAGRGLEAVRLDGWRQAWIVPAGAGGAVRLTFTPSGLYRAGLAVGAVGVMLVLLAALLPKRHSRRDPPAALPRTVSAALAGATASGAVFVVAGPVALAVPLLLVWGLVTRRAVPLAAVAGLTYAAAGLLVVLRPGQFPGSSAGAYSTPAQVLAAMSLAALLATVVTSAAGEE